MTTPKYKSYLFNCQENQQVYRVLASRKWKTGEKVVLPPIRVRSTPDKLYGNKYVVYLYRLPINYKNSGYLPKRNYQIKPKGKDSWKLIPCKF